MKGMGISFVFQHLVKKVVLVICPIVNTVTQACSKIKILDILIKSTISLEGWQVLEAMGKEITFSPNSEFV